MKRILGKAMMLGLLGAVTLIAGCSKEKDDVVNLGNNVVIDLGNNVKLDMVLIPAGKFMMGSKKMQLILSVILKLNNLPKMNYLIMK